MWWWCLNKQTGRSYLPKTKQNKNMSVFTVHHLVHFGHQQKCPKCCLLKILIHSWKFKEVKFLTFHFSCWINVKRNVFFQRWQLIFWDLLLLRVTFRGAHWPTGCILELSLNYDPGFDRREAMKHTFSTNATESIPLRYAHTLFFSEFSATVFRWAERNLRVS